MYTSTELQLLRNADPGVKLPGIDTPAGDPLAAGSLKPLSSMTTSSKAPFYYSAAANVVYVTQAGATLSGYNFGNATVDVDASNVTIEDCNFTATTGWYAVQVHDGENNTTVTNSSFNSDAIPAKLAAWITSTGTVNVTDNSFIDTPADGLDVFGGGVISGNYFSGAGYLPPGCTRTRSGSPTAQRRSSSPTISSTRPPIRTPSSARTTASASPLSSAASAT